MPLAEIASALTSLKAAFDMTKAMKDIRDATSFQGKVFELQRTILEAQSQAIEARDAHSADVKRIGQLEEEIARLKAWDGEKERYELIAVGHGAFVYALKPEMAGGEPSHWLCTTCYQKRQKSILQEMGRMPDRSYAIWRCPSCQAVASIYYTHNPKKPDG